MKKFGFTLAEVLITLMIIGVVAALTLPSLINETTSAQIGPKLAKAVSVFEQANETLLNTNSVDNLTDAGMITEDEEGNVLLSEYINQLSNHLKISEYTYPEETQFAKGEDEEQEEGLVVGATFADGTPFITKDGMIYVINKDQTPSDVSVPAHKQRIGNVYIDINGPSKPNELGTDIFVFTWWNDGSLRPVGGNNWDGSGASQGWETYCPKDAVPTDYKACTGHIFENNLKVLYK